MRDPEPTPHPLPWMFVPTGLGHFNPKHMSPLTRVLIRVHRGVRQTAVRGVFSPDDKELLVFKVVYGAIRFEDGVVEGKDIDAPLGHIWMSHTTPREDRRRIIEDLIQLKMLGWGLTLAKVDFIGDRRDWDD